MSVKKTFTKAMRLAKIASNYQMFARCITYIDWKQRPLAQWLSLFRRAKRMNWQQSLAHARVRRLEDKKSTHLAVIKEGEKILGVFAVEKLRFGPVESVSLYRGPLWFHEDPPIFYLKEFARLFNEAFPRSLLRKRAWLPEWPSSIEVQFVLKAQGFRPKNASFATMWLDLTQDEEQIKARFAQKWRNGLHKAQRSGLEVRVDNDARSCQLFLAHYRLHLHDKSYQAKSANYVKTEILAAKDYRSLWILWAYQGETPLASVLVFEHGTSATYRAGWTSLEGRRSNAHHLLLWEAVRLLKLKSLESFDLGGLVVDPSGEGVNRFKSGMRGELYVSPGIFS